MNGIRLVVRCCGRFGISPSNKHTTAATTQLVSPPKLFAPSLFYVEIFLFPFFLFLSFCFCVFWRWSCSRVTWRKQRGTLSVPFSFESSSVVSSLLIAV